MIILTAESISYIIQDETVNKQLCEYIKSALYTSGRVPFSLFSVPWFLYMCQLSNRHRSRCADDGQWPQLWRGPVSGLCPKCALKGLMQLHHNSSGPVDALLVSVWEFGQSVWCIPWGMSYIRIWSTHTLLLLQWYWVFGVYLHVTEGAQWMRDHLDVQPCKIRLTERSLM